MSLYRHTYDVISRSPFTVFPLDMMRYDRSTPNTGEDVRVIHDSIEIGLGLGTVNPNEDQEKLNTRVRLVHYGAKNWYPTDGRWQSFGWDIDWGSFEERKV
jgi:hypothetical protein